MRTSRTGFLMVLLVLVVLPTTKAQTSRRNTLLYPTADKPNAIDRGTLTAEAGTTPISVTIFLSLPTVSEAENLLKALSTPGDPQFHHFLSAEQFVAVSLTCPKSFRLIQPPQRGSRC
jgi:subtilase family serine protease